MKGSGPKKVGNAHLKWAFSEAACLMIRAVPALSKLPKPQKEHESAPDVRRANSGVRDDQGLGHDHARLFRRLHVLLDYGPSGADHPVAVEGVDCQRSEQDGVSRLCRSDAMHDLRSEIMRALIECGMRVDAHRHEAATGGQARFANSRPPSRSSATLMPRRTNGIGLQKLFPTPTPNCIKQRSSAGAA